MLENFTLKKRNNEIVGYSFPCEEPKHVMTIIHGIGEHAGRYNRMAEKLNENGIAVLSMDLRGHGKSQGKRGHAAPRKDVLEDIDALLEYAEEIYPNVPLVFYGHSMGGNIALDYMMHGEHNDIPTGYIISAPWIELVRPVKGPLYTVVKTCAKVAPSLSISSGCDEASLGNLKYVRPYLKDPLVHDKITMLCAYEGFSIGKAIEEGNHTNNHRADNTPLLLMHGDSDKICSVQGSRNLAALYKDRNDFTYHELQGYYHEIHNGGPEHTGRVVIEEIIDFVLKH